MIRSRIVGVGLLMLSILRSSSALAEPPKRQTFGMCAHPHGANVNRWSYVYSTLDLVSGAELDRALSAHADLALFYYDPNAPLGNLQTVPLRYTNRPTKCEPAPPPQKPKPPPPPPKPLEEEDEDPPAKESKGNGNGSGKKGNGSGGGGDGSGPPSKEPGDGRPPAEKKGDGKGSPTEDEKHAQRKHEQKERCAAKPEECPDPILPWEGVLKKEFILPAERILRSDRLLPTPEEMRAQPDPPGPSMEAPPETLEERDGVLPMLLRGPEPRPVLSVLSCSYTKEGCKEDGDGKKENKEPKKEKTGFEKFAEELAIAAAMANTQMNEDLHRPDGKKFGIVGGQNPDGPNNPALQAAVSAVQLSAAVLVQVSAFENKLLDAIQKKKSLVITNAAELSDEAIEALVQRHGGEELAAALSQMKVIAPYSLWKKFTAKLGGSWQAHHILEKAKIGRFGIKLDPDLAPSVILSAAEHKRFTKDLAEETRNAVDLPMLWDAYKKVYQLQPEWLKAIEPYFVKP